MARRKPNTVSFAAGRQRRWATYMGSSALVASGDCGHSNNGSVTMINNHFPTLFSTLVVLVAVAAPANAAEGVEAKLQVCGSCHGDNGQPIDATIPIIWGQTEYFIVKQLHDYKSGDRENTVMAAFAKRLTQAELRPAAAYFAKKSW